MSVNMQVGELVFEETMRLSGAVDFGIGLEPVLSGSATIPPEGLRLDASFEGEIKGDRIAGTIAGWDYVTVRGDGAFLLNVHAAITTADEKRIAFAATGTLEFPEGSQSGELRENVTLYSAFPEYSWVNKLQFWSTGSQDPATGETTFRCYRA